MGEVRAAGQPGASRGTGRNEAEEDTDMEAGETRGDFGGVPAMLVQAPYAFPYPEREELQEQLGLTQLNELQVRAALLTATQ